MLQCPVGHHEIMAVFEAVDFGDRNRFRCRIRRVWITNIGDQRDRARLRLSRLAVAAAR
jgi:hypothetical protein